MKKRLLALSLSLLLLVPSAGALTVEQARELVEKVYIDEVPQDILNRPTVEEIFAGLDEYSSYFTPEQYQSFLDTMNDVSLVGVGVVMRMTEDADALEILQVYAGGAAHAAGVVAGDLIVAVDGKRVADATGGLDEVNGWIRGEEDTQVALTLKRANGKTETLTLTRATFVIPYTQHELVDGHIGYISCLSFGQETYDHFVEALDEMDGQVNAWVLDLRGNGGGDVQAATDVAGIFSGTGVKAVLEQRGPIYYAYVAEKERTTLYPAILLVDGDSASASELLAAAIRDGDAGLIIGSRTYGKGVAQTVVDQREEPEYFPDGDGVRITSARFYSPDGISNDKLGVLPHLLVEDEYAQDIALLLCAEAPVRTNQDYLRIHAGSWRWYLSLEQALSEEYRPAFVALLEALWPEADLFMGAGGGRWEEMTPRELALIYHLDEYTPRTFADVSSSIFEYELNVLGTYGMLQGDGGGNVNPEGELTRAQLCAMLAQVLNTDVQPWPNRFSDVAEDAWYAPAVNAMAALGLVDGDEAGLFRPEEVLTQEQMVIILGRFTRWLNADFNGTGRVGPEEGMLGHTSLMGYSDWAKESAWLMGLAYQNMYGDSISYVYTDIHKVEPQAPATREQAAASIFRSLELWGDFNP